MCHVKRTCYKILSSKTWREPKTVMFLPSNVCTINWINYVISNSHGFIVQTWRDVGCVIVYFPMRVAKIMCRTQHGMTFCGENLMIKILNIKRQQSSLSRPLSFMSVGTIKVKGFCLWKRKEKSGNLSHPCFLFVCFVARRSLVFFIALPGGKRRTYCDSFFDLLWSGQNKALRA